MMDHNIRVKGVIWKITYVVTPNQNRLGETVLMMDHNICVKGVIREIIPKLFLLPLPIWSTALWINSIPAKRMSGLFIYFFTI